jgi:septal ring factor EnvC (AmiA/AmiB activator)
MSPTDHKTPAEHRHEESVEDPPEGEQGGPSTASIEEKVQAKMLERTKSYAYLLALALGAVTAGVAMVGSYQSVINKSDQQGKAIEDLSKQHERDLRETNEKNEKLGETVTQHDREITTLKTEAVGFSQTTIRIEDSLKSINQKLDKLAERH